jgi:hypothetical protein
MAVDFRAKQAEFAAYIRDPANPAPADVKPERMAMYRELFFNNIDSCLSTNFPVLRTLLDDQQWQALCKDFFAKHACQTPYFSEIAEEFLEYLPTRDYADDYPFLWELAHYEWVEMALAIAKDEPVYGDAEFIEQLAERRLALSPVAWLLAYQYPVQQISPDYLPTEPPAAVTYLVVYRDQYHDVHFMQAVPLTFRLLQLLEQQPMTVAAAIQSLSPELPNLNSEALLQHALISLQAMAGKGIIIPSLD